MKPAGNPWMKFYPSDWRADPALRSCTIAARGLWVEMLALMHEAEPYGSLLINGARIDKKRMAALAGIRETECTVLMLELEGFGVFSRDENGTIYSRRMRRDAAKAIKDKENGKKGGNPTVKAGVNPPVNGEVKAQKPEAKYQKEKETRESALWFESFWLAWPNKVGKPAAQKAFRSATGRAPSLEAILDGVKRYIRDKPPDRPWLNPATFLNQNRWEDQPAGNGPAVVSIISEKIPLDEAVAQFARFGRWSRHSPVNDISQVPPELLAKHGLLADGRKSLDDDLKRGIGP